MRIAFALFDDAEELDVVGPYEVLAYWAESFRHGRTGSASVVTVADAARPVRCAKGLRLVPDVSWAELGAIDVVVYPGGRGTRSQLTPNGPIHDRLRALRDSGVLMTSVCTGALVFAAAGILRGRPATTHWRSLDLLAQLDPSIDVRPDERFVDDGDVITASGVSAGIDMALHLVARLDSPEVARDVRRAIQYDPQPPV